MSGAETEVKHHLLNSYSLQQIVYYATTMVAAGIMKETEAESLDKEIYYKLSTRPEM